jgi:hypothetical protein
MLQGYVIRGYNSGPACMLHLIAMGKEVKRYFAAAEASFSHGILIFPLSYFLRGSIFSDCSLCLFTLHDVTGRTFCLEATHILTSNQGIFPEEMLGFTYYSSLL